MMWMLKIHIFDIFDFMNVSKVDILTLAWSSFHFVAFGGFLAFLYELVVASSGCS